MAAIYDRIKELDEDELAVLRLMASGLNQKEIAERLQQSHGMVRKRAHQIYAKLGVTNNVEAVIVALASGEIDLTDAYAAVAQRAMVRGANGHFAHDNA